MPDAFPLDFARFIGHAGAALLQEAVGIACTFAAAQAPEDEILAALMVRFSLSKAEAEYVLQAGADAIEAHRLAAKAAARLTIHNLCQNPEAKAPQVSILREFAQQHLDWTSRPIDSELASALKEAERIQKSSKRR